MKKFTLLIALSFIYFDTTAQVSKIPLIEHFTQASCGPCAQQNPPMYNRLNAFGESNFNKITYQVSFPGVDPMYSEYKAGPDNRRNYYGVSGVPNATINGGPRNSPGNTVTTAKLNEAAKLKTPYKLEVIETRNGSEVTVNITVTNTTASAISGADRLHVAMIEKHIKFSQPPGNNGEKDFYNVTRNMYNASTGASSTDGLTIGSIPANGTLSYSFVANIPSYVRKSEQIGFVAFLQKNSTKEVFQSASGIVGGAPSANDPGFDKNETPNIFCGSPLDLKVSLRNYGTNPLTSATIEVFEGSNSISTKNWTGNLATNASESILLTNVSPTIATTYTARITSSNDNTLNDKLSILIELAPKLIIDKVSKEVHFDLNVDKFASDVGIVFNEGSIPGSADQQYFIDLYLAAASNPSSVLGFVKIETYTNGTNKIDKTWKANNQGCHYAVFIDNYGDGYAAEGYSGAYIKIKGIPSSSLSVNPDFQGQIQTQIFNIENEGTIGLYDENLLSQFNLYPNPTTDIINVDFRLQDENNVTVSILNTMGQTVDSKNIKGVSGTQNIQFNTSQLDAGIYFVKVKTKNTEQVKRLSVVK